MSLAVRPAAPDGQATLAQGLCMGNLDAAKLNCSIHAGCLHCHAFSRCPAGCVSCAAATAASGLGS